MAPNRTTLECFLLVVSLLCLGVFHSVFCMLGCCLWQVRFGWDQGALEISLSTHVSRPLGWRVFVLRFSVDSRFNFQNFALILKHFCTIRASVSFVCVLYLFFGFEWTALSALRGLVWRVSGRYFSTIGDSTICCSMRWLCAVGEQRVCGRREFLSSTNG